MKIEGHRTFKLNEMYVGGWALVNKQYGIFVREENEETKRLCHIGLNMFFRSHEGQTEELT